ncbi:exodeoxyribonuclease III [Ferrovibrio terrae]|uniref:exodeoxyribonuclease III n=1 Tax=Ferrovibrio terrae TaxID=2594003 RepID=UPI001FE3673F|nr:exodeoxyribonuclease III [Ferrovibrio terrae]
MAKAPAKKAPSRPITLATWNINSVRARLDLMAGFLSEHNPDILCLQETKVKDVDFPHELFEQRGYTHRLIHGQPGYNGVAIFAKTAITLKEKLNLAGRDDRRHIAAELADGTILHNYYVPAGGDIPDPKVNDKFQHKLDVLAGMTKWSAALKKKGGKEILVGDLNIAPLETDVWAHKPLLKIVSHTPIETEGMLKMQAARDWVDAVRHFVPPSEKIYSWWSYRSPDWATADKGRRLDHVWVSPQLKDSLAGVKIVKDMRGRDKASDHVPIIVTLKLG